MTIKCTKQLRGDRIAFHPKELIQTVNPQAENTHDISDQLISLLVEMAIEELEEEQKVQ